MLVSFYIDIDDFKSFNDALGQVEADQLLAAIAGRLKEIVRRDDVLARLGGDKFVMLLRDAALDSSRHELLLSRPACIAEPVQLAAREVTLTARVGIAIYPRDGRTTNALLRVAESALDGAKQHGHAQTSCDEMQGYFFSCPIPAAAFAALLSLARAREIYPKSIRIALSAHAEVDMTTDAVNRGTVSRYFTKPWNDEALRKEIRRAFRGVANGGYTARQSQK